MNGLNALQNDLRMVIIKMMVFRPWGQSLSGIAPV
jgi:hypothetical protein